MLAKFFFILVFFVFLAVLDRGYLILDKFWTRKNVRHIERQIRKFFTRP